MILARLLRFRREVLILWRAFWHPNTPLHLKAITVFTVLYLVSPIDLIPDLVPVIGWLDDLIIIPMLVSWIVSQLPAAGGHGGSTHQTSGNRSERRGASTPHGDERVIDGTARRL